MLSENQREQILKLLKFGFNDPMIATMIDGVTPIDVYNYRHANGITSKDVLENRYNTWAKLVDNGVSINRIAELYHVKVTTLKGAIWKTRSISFVEVKAKQQQNGMKMWTQGKDGLPDFDKLV
ncbi:hypothetical protein [Herbaspirillum sp. RV1423]|uniref:hypothetical protein n=1 Tax=Herbaspirillum sp. RV1423 TaxID=1443993 RepID=UPI00054FD171|nr:hypothetical protein [Herbaspirillum sp. RV1423]